MDNSDDVYTYKIIYVQIYKIITINHNLYFLFIKMFYVYCMYIHDTYNKIMLNVRNIYKQWNVS